MTKLIACIAASVLLLPAAATTQPVQNISPKRHGNLAAAQQLTAQASARITAAQQNNEFDLGGHATRAKELLRQANQQLKLAAQSANRH